MNRIETAPVHYGTVFGSTWRLRQELETPVTTGLMRSRTTLAHDSASRPLVLEQESGLGSFPRLRYVIPSSRSVLEESGALEVSDNGMPNENFPARSGRYRLAVIGKQGRFSNRESAQ